MNKTCLKSKKLLVLSLVVFITLLSICFTASVFASENADNVWTFSAGNVADPMYVKEYFTEIPVAYEAEVNFESKTYSTASPIIANYPNNTGFDCFGFEIHASGNPAVYYYASSYDTSTNKVTQLKNYVRFTEYDVRGKGWVRISVTDDVMDGNHVYTLYVNGEMKQQLTQTNYEVDALYSQGSTRELSVGTDGKNYFKGQLRNVAVYNKALTKSELANTARENLNAGNEKLEAYYDATMSGNAVGLIKDQTANGHDASKAFFERKNELKDYAYSFAFVGDTQFLVEQDVNSSTDKYTAPIYDWIVANKDSKKIQRVIGLGDITDDNKDTEWAYAVTLHKKLSDANIPYAVIAGNHDGINKLDTYFGVLPELVSEVDGYYSGSSLGNYYMKFEVGSHKYMLVALQYGADDGALAWANNVVAQNPDRRVIVITHNLLGYEGQWTEVDTREESTTNVEPSESSTRNNGIDMWNEFISLHENIIIAACGHICPEHIKHRTDVGVNGNTVNTFLIDPQGLDKATEYKTGMVAMFYFSEDGSDVQVEYVSTYKTLEAQAADPSADDVLFHEINQFSVKIDYEQPSANATAYGDLPTSVIEAGNKFAIFSNGEFKGAYMKWNAATQALADYFKVNKNATVQLLLLGDYNNSGDSIVINALNYANGNLVIDLNDYTFTVNATFLNLNNYYDINNYDSSNIVIKNGTVLSGNRAVIANQINNVGSNGQSYASEKTWNLTFDNVTLGYGSGFKASTPAFYDAFKNSATADASQLGAKTNITFNNCTFDLKTNRSDANIKLFDLEDDINKVDVSVKINGGEILADIADLAKVTFYTLNNGADTDNFVFGANAGGAFVKLNTHTTAKNYAHYSKALPATDGDRYFVEISDNGSGAVYELRKIEKTYEYELSDGSVKKVSFDDAKYLSNVDYPGLFDTKNYPFIVFDQSGKYYGVYDYLYKNQSGSAMSNAIYSVLNTKEADGKYSHNEGNTAYILMRSDYTMRTYKDSNGATKAEYFNNLAHARGKVVIDMRGYSIVADSTRTTEIFLSDVKTWTGTSDGVTSFNSYYEIKNGTIKTYNKAAYVISFKASNGSDVSNKLMSWNFENVTFGVVNGNATTQYLFHVKTAENTGSSVQAPVDLKLNDCTFDYRVAPNVNDFRIIGPYFHVKNARLKANIEVNGGSLLANSVNKISLAVFEHAYNCTLSFGPGSDGKYFSVNVPSGVSISKFSTKISGTFDGLKTKNGTELTFVSVAQEGGNVLYRLRPVAVSDLDYAPKMSITLGNSFVMNVYVPVDCTQKFTFNGITYDLSSDYTGVIETIDGKGYYLVQAPLGSSEAAKSVKLVANVSVAEGSAVATFTLSIPTYVTKLINGGSEIEKTLGYDVLAYIKAAYEYFGTDHNSSNEIARVTALVDSIIGDYKATPVLSGVTNTVSPVTSVTLNLDAKPTVRFYATDVSVSFYANGKKLNTVTGTDAVYGAYVELDVYAYALAETITYGDGGSYHVSDFVNGAKETDHEALVNAFVKYVESAAAYRNSVVNK